MPCNVLVPASCVISGAADAAGGLIGNQFAQAMADGAEWVLKTTVGWWVEVPAIDLATSPAATIRASVLWLSVAVATVGVMWQGILLAITRRPAPLLGIGRGLFTLSIVAALGILAPAAALRAGDAFSTWVLNKAASGHAAERLVSLADLSGINSAGAIIVLGLLMMLSGLAQAVVMIFREGAVVVLAGVLVLAAAGSFTNATRPWLHRVVGWLAALIAYKPIAALVYATALAMVGEGNDPRTLLVGLTMIMLAIFALPALMKFFTWTTGSVSSAGGGGAVAALGAGASAIHATSALSGGGTSAATQASHIRHDLGSPISAGAISAAAPVGAAAAVPSTASAAGLAAGPVGVAVVAGKAAAETAGRASDASQRNLTERPDA